ncbi:hypothetical protein KC19_2G126100 [Ceratodon purpureus]|uniref:Uncharacterized protein n=1 Tax=Ceratodon purpureus TaxID=3225 RepID=A0A8T0IX29_CERPU|nr:hypothetical protein KC19_2G126100 [Ceratodon purpureus]
MIGEGPKTATKRALAAITPSLPFLVPLIEPGNGLMSPHQGSTPALLRSPSAANFRPGSRSQPAGSRSGVCSLAPSTGHCGVACSRGGASRVWGCSGGGRGAS